jgi:hypothetical protein
MNDATKPFLYNNDFSDSEENNSVEFVKSGNISKYRLSHYVTVMDDATKPFLYNDSSDSEENDSVEFVKSRNISKKGTTSTESIVNILTSKPSFVYVILMLGLMSFHIVSSLHVHSTIWM